MLDIGEKNGVAMPLFGGGDAYFETLLHVLDFVEMASPEKRELIQWFKTTFPNVSSDDSITRRVSFLTSTQFLVCDDEAVYTLGPAGRRLHATRSPDTAYNILKSKVTAIEIVLKYLCRGQVDIETLQTTLDHDYDRVKWKINWLRSLGFANQVEGESYTSTDLGKDVYRAYADPEQT